MNKDVNVVWPKWERLLNPSFVPLTKNKDRYLCLYGGRGSSKSNAIAKILIYRALTEPYFRFILARKYYTSIRNSQFSTLKDLITQMNLANLFQFRSQPYEIECTLNGNIFIAAGCDEPQKIKSIKDPTGVWYEEDIVDESDWITITTSIRTTKARFLQEIFTINPEVEGEYQDNWLFKKFFKDWWAHDNLNHSGKTTVKLPSGIEVTSHYTVHHSDYTHNKYLPDEFRAFLESMAKTNPYYYEVYTRGLWGNREMGGRFYPEFSRHRHTMDLRLKDPHHEYGYRGYKKDWGLHLTFDFNVRPYMTLIISQVNNLRVYVIDEIAAKEPNNSTPAICRLFMQKYGAHQGPVYIYGDPSGRAASTKTEQGDNEYNIIRKILAPLAPTVRVDSKSPGVELRGQFMNEIFKGNFGGLSIIVDSSCPYTIDDLLYTQAAADGTKHKARTRDKESNISFEARGHFSDALDYFICRLFRAQWREYKSGKGSKVLQQYNYVLGRDKGSTKFRR